MTSALDLNLNGSLSTDHLGYHSKAVQLNKQVLVIKICLLLKCNFSIFIPVDDLLFTITSGCYASFACGLV